MRSRPVPRRTLLAAAPAALVSCMHGGPYFGTNRPPACQRLVYANGNEPDTFDPYDQLNIDYKHYRRPREVHPDKDGQWVLIVPVLPGQQV